MIMPLRFLSLGPSIVDCRPGLFRVSEDFLGQGRVHDGTGNVFLLDDKTR